MPAVPNGARKLTIGDFDLALDPEAPACDLAPLTFIDAYGLVGTACALRIALAGDPNFPVQLAESESMNAHLAAMGFQNFLSETGRSSLLETEAAFDASSVVVPLQSAADSGGEQALSHLLWEQLRDHVHPQVLAAITEGVWEMVGNALEHSGSDALDDRGAEPAVVPWLDDHAADRDTRPRRLARAGSEPDPACPGRSLGEDGRPGLLEDDRRHAVVPRRGRQAGSGTARGRGARGQ